MFTNSELVSEVRMSSKQIEELNIAKHWIEENIPTAEKCILTGTSVDNGVLCDGAILAIIVKCDSKEALLYRHLIFKYNCSKTNNILLRLVIAGQEDDFEDLNGGICV